MCVCVCVRVCVCVCVCVCVRVRAHATSLLTDDERFSNLHIVIVVQYNICSVKMMLEAHNWLCCASDLPVVSAGTDGSGCWYSCWRVIV